MRAVALLLKGAGDADAEAGALAVFSQSLAAASDALGPRHPLRAELSAAFGRALGLAGRPAAGAALAHVAAEMFESTLGAASAAVPEALCAAAALHAAAARAAVGATADAAALATAHWTAAYTLLQRAEGAAAATSATAVAAGAGDEDGGPRAARARLAEARAQLAIASSALGRDDEALGAAERAVAVGGAREGVLLAALLERADRPREALDALEGALAVAASGRASGFPARPRLRAPACAPRTPLY